MSNTNSKKPSLPCAIILKLLQYGVDYPLKATSPSAVAAPVESQPVEDDACSSATVTTMPDDSSHVPSIVGGHGPLHAWVSMASEYTRTLMTDALRRRKHIFSYVANNEMEAPTQGLVDTAAAQAQAAEQPFVPNNTNTAPWPINLHMCEFERIDWGSGLSGDNSSSTSGPMLVSAYPVRKGLIRKAQLAFLLRKYAAKRPDSILHKTIPETHLMTIDDPEYLEEALNDVYEVRDMVEGVDMWIMKASMINRALGIHLIASVRDVERIVCDPAYEEIREWVMQRYIQRPYLIDGCKFHIRAYVLAIGNLRAFMWSEMLCLIAPAKYDRDVLDRAAHITNTCANSDREGFEESKQIRLLSEVFPADMVQQLHGQMSSTLHDVFAALHGEPTVFLPIPNGFEHFGMDFIVDETGGVFFLEANAGPDFGMTGERLQGLVESMMESTFQLAVDPFIREECDKIGMELPKPSPEDEARNKAECQKMKGEFIPCYDVKSQMKVTMNFF